MNSFISTMSILNVTLQTMLGITSVTTFTTWKRFFSSVYDHMSLNFWRGLHNASTVRTTILLRSKFDRQEQNLKERKNLKTLDNVRRKQLYNSSRNTWSIYLVNTISLVKMKTFISNVYFSCETSNQISDYMCNYNQGKKTLFLQCELEYVFWCGKQNS